jgi:hypothetical protein
METVWFIQPKPARNARENFALDADLSHNAHVPERVAFRECDASIRNPPFRV